MNETWGFGCLIVGAGEGEFQWAEAAKIRERGLNAQW